MKSFIKRVIKKFAPFAFLEPEGERGIDKIGHRDYVGGMWDEIGGLQFDFLISKGLKPNHFLLDIACGSLRLGVKAIPYLERSHYLGIEKESGLVAAGLENELPAEIRTEKQPNIIISDAFEFENLGQKADFAIAQSLFSHFPPDLINLCFSRLHPWLADGGLFYATFFEVSKERHNPEKPHDHGYFAYTKEQMLKFGEDNGFSSQYIGEWNHPRQQMIVEYRKTPPA